MPLLDLTIIIFLILFGMFLYLPYLSWPADPHYGVFTLWTLFKKPEEPIPEQLILGNQGFSRIYLHYVMHGLHKLWGRENLLVSGRIAQGVMMAMTGAIIYCMARFGLNVCLSSAFASGVFYIFAVTRPHFDPIRINAEPYYTIGASVAVWILLVSLKNQQVFPLLFAAGFLLVFLALNTKIVYLIDFVILGIGMTATSGLIKMTMLAGCSSALAATLVFYLLFRQYLGMDKIRSLLLYAGWARSVAAKLDVRNVVTSVVMPTSLPRLTLLGVAGAVLSIISQGNGILICWIVSSFLVIILQRRLCNYHFQTVLAPLAVAASLIFDLVFKLPWMYWVPFLFLIFLLERVSILKAAKMFVAKDGEEKLSLALGGDYYKYFDTRLSSIVWHIQNHKSSFIIWGITPQLYSITGCPPCPSVGVVTRLDCFPGHREELLQAVATEQHAWIYDLSDNLQSKGAFNPLLFYKATGCLYRQVKRENNIGYFEFIGKNNDISVTPINLFVEMTPDLDLLAVEVKEAGLHDSELLGRQHDLLRLATLLVVEQSEKLTKEVTGLAEIISEISLDGIGHLFAAIIFYYVGDIQKGVKQFRLWDYADNPYLKISPSLQAVTWLLRRRISKSADQWPLPKDILNRVQFYEAARLAPFMHNLALSSVVSKEEKENLIASLQSARSSDGPYDDWRSRNKLSDFLKEYGYV